MRHATPPPSTEANGLLAALQRHPAALREDRGAFLEFPERVETGADAVFAAEDSPRVPQWPQDRLRDAGNA